MGILLSLITAVFSSSKDLVSKKISFNVGGGLSAFASFLFAVPFYCFALLAAWLTGFESFAFSWHFFTLVVLRSITDALAEWFKMEAFSRADVSVVTCLVATAPVFLLFWSPVITGDAGTPAGIIGVLVVVAGNMVLFFPGREKIWSPAMRRGALLAVAAALFFSLNTCFDRLAVQTASPLLSGFAMTLLAGVLLLPQALRKSAHPAQLWTYRGPFMIRGFFEVSFMVSKLAALQYMQAPYVAAVAGVSLIFSILGGRIIFGEKQVFRRLFAGALILCGALIIGWTEFSR